MKSSILLNRLVFIIILNFIALGLYSRSGQIVTDMFHKLVRLGKM